MDMDTVMRPYLGQSANLLTGYKADIYSVPFNKSSKPALNDGQVIVRNPDYDAEWSWPTISLHDKAEDLLSAVLQIKLRPLEDVSDENGMAGVWPAGALILAGLSRPTSARSRALKKLSHQLGVNLKQQDWSYALVRRTRKIGTAIHPCYERGVFGHPYPETILKPDTLAALKSLEKMRANSTNVSKRGAEGYLDFYETFGSHFVSSVDTGDTIFQVFAFASTDYQNIVRVYEKSPNDLSGPKSTSFALFTTPRSGSGYGYTAAIGKICITSQDPEMVNSLKHGLWKDEKYACTNSIFAPFLRSDAINANTTFKKVVVISIELASLDVFAEYFRMLIWRRVFKAAMYAKYLTGVGVAPYFTNNCPYDLDSMFQDSDPIVGDGLLSTLATSSVNIWQEKLNLGDIALQFPELVKVFSVFANAIQIPATSSNEKTVIHVPGSSTVSLLGHVITSGGTGPRPPNLRLSDPALKEIKSRLFFGEFYGGLQISSSSDTKGFLIMNGLIFKEVKGQVSVVRDVRETLNVAILTERLTDIQFALVAAEARLNFLLSNAVPQGQSLKLLKRFLLWLAGVAGSNYQYQDDQLATLQARAMYLVSVVAADQGAGVPVPYLRYEAYKDVVENVQHVLRTASSQLMDYQKQIRARKAEERQVQRDTALNKNIVNSGKILQNYIGAQASYQQSLEDMFSSVYQEKMDELEKANKRADQLSARLSEQRVVVNDAIEEYKEAVGRWITEQNIKAAIDIASSLFSLGFTFAAPASSIGALSDLGLTVQRIQKAVEVFDAVIMTYRTIKAIPSNPKKVVDSLQDIGLSGLELPSSLEWDEMKVNFEATLASGPAIEAKNTLSAVFAVMVLRGKDLLQTQSTIQGIVADLSANQQRISLHKCQKKRLDELKVNLNAKPENLDVEKVDLIGLSGKLNFFQRQMLMTLASTMVIQDRALQYEYLRPPTRIESFTMLNLQLAILNQSQNINYGLTVQPQPKFQNYPIIYEIHGVTPDSITNNQRYTFNISLNKREFSSYNYVRIEGIHVEIGGITFTNSGKYYTELVFDGNPFFDRGFDGEPLEFQTTSRIFTGLHDVSTSSHVVYDHGNVQNPDVVLATTGQDHFGAKTSSITPFSSWQVSLPKTQSNEGIEFDDYSRGVTVRLIFRIYAQLKESTMTPSEMNSAARRLLTRQDYVKPIESVLPMALAGKLPTARPSTSDGATTTTSVSRDDVLRAMKGTSVCAGWDVVFSMTAKRVNDQLYGQYANRKDNPVFIRETGNIEKEYKTSEGKTLKTVFNFTFNAPRLQFLLNNSNSAQVFMPIISGTYEYSVLVNDTWIELEKAEVKKTDGAFIQGDVPLSIVPGSVSTQHNVAIKLNGGSFSARNFKAGNTNPTFGFALTNYFTSLKDGYEVYNLGTLDLKGITILDSLNPNDFQFNVYHTPSNRDLLQLFIATTGRLQSATSLYIQEPIPSTYDSSLIINSKIFFQDVMPTALGDGGIGLALEAIEPPDDANTNTAWSAKATSGSVSAPFPVTKVDSDATSNKGSTTHFEYFVKVGNDTAVVDLTGMQFLPGDETSGWVAKVVYSPGCRKYSFKYGSRWKICTLFGCDEWSKIDYSNHSLGVTIDMETTLPLSVTGDGQNQSIGFAATESSVSLTGNLKPPGGVCKCNDRDLQKKFLDNLKKILPKELVGVFNKSFDAVSLFALKNLLFPAKNLITLEEGAVPGDLIVFGNFTPV
ncbi:uncharacterized protein LOC119734556 [Patiria miniata]|uniref:Uncharacterized protein n=1 Tax=Patiria miniata TaxID=46514 RepID=A0A914AJZ3_PATMI|nr:uncharacterized protein LOC119734556 [Patiria miniata]